MAAGGNRSGAAIVNRRERAVDSCIGIQGQTRGITVGQVTQDGAARWQFSARGGCRNIVVSHVDRGAESGCSRQSSRRANNVCTVGQRRFGGSNRKCAERERKRAINRAGGADGATGSVINRHILK